MAAKLPIHVVADLWSKETGQSAVELERLLLPWFAERSVARAAPRLDLEDESERGQGHWRPPLVHRGTLMEQGDLASSCAEQGLKRPKFWFARGPAGSATTAAAESGQAAEPATAPPQPAAKEPPPAKAPPPRAAPPPHRAAKPQQGGPQPPRSESSSWRRDSAGAAGGAWVRRASEGGRERQEPQQPRESSKGGKLMRSVGWASAACLLIAFAVLLLPPEDDSLSRQGALPEETPAASSLALQGDAGEQLAEPGTATAFEGSLAATELEPTATPGAALDRPATAAAPQAGGSPDVPPLPPTLVTDAQPVRDPGASAAPVPHAGAPLAAEAGGSVVVAARSGEPETVVRAVESPRRQEVKPQEAASAESGPAAAPRQIDGASAAAREVVAALPPDRSAREVTTAAPAATPPAEVVTAREAAEQVETARLPPSSEPLPEEEEEAALGAPEQLRDREALRRLQELLKAAGYDPGVPDGIYGARTGNAIRAWQAERGLEADGIATARILAALEQQQPQESAPPSPPAGDRELGSPREIVLAALKAQQSGALEQAIDLYSRAMAAKGLPLRDLAHALNNRAVARAGLGDLTGAIEDCSRAIAVIGNYPAAFLNRGIALRRLGQTDDAINDFNAAIRIQPRYAKAYLARAQAREDKADIEGAIVDYSHALDIEPSSALAHFQRGRAYRLAGNASLARADFEKAANLEPNNRIYEAALRDLGSNS